MDPVEAYIISGQNFSLARLQEAHRRLSYIQENEGRITQEATVESLQGDEILDQASANAYAGLIISAAKPALTSSGQIELQLTSDLDVFLDSILRVLWAKCKGKEFANVTQLRTEWQSRLGASGDSNSSLDSLARSRGSSPRGEMLESPEVAENGLGLGFNMGAPAPEGFMGPGAPGMGKHNINTNGNTTGNTNGMSYSTVNNVNYSNANTPS
eukprot:CAMPEP_0173199350 /NCGR_PEP_ID=MMETSP1141-20130122/17189_1 /TAXON_ID=483371 /ORGANISM="non described non described, Strain CCMP2298" /LENGTH=212 /DNA_ID=CAMNT_0014124235 /DNA_START=147 /DNA_END=782 /DNA_ORIENTATION=-